MKTKYFLIGFLLLTLIAYSTSVQGASTWEVEEDKLYIYEIKSFDEDLADDVFDTDNIEDVLGEDADIDAMRAQMITDADEIEDFNGDATEDDPGWEFDGWVWVGDWMNDEDDFEDPEVPDIMEYSDVRIPEDPEEYGLLSGFLELFVFFYIISIGVPSPAEDWLDDGDWSSLDPDDGALTLEIDSSSDPDVYEDYEQVYTWDEDGVYQGVEAIVDGDTIYEVSLKGGLLDTLLGIPGYELPILLGVVGVSAIGIIYVIMKKK